MAPIPDPHPGVPVHVVVMGVSGTGKSTIGRALADALGWPFAEGDEHHPAGNVAKMAAGFPLTDEDRWPWLRGLAGWLAVQDRAGSCSVLTCSALRRPYRDLLREGAPGLYFVHLVGDTSLLLERMQSRQDHFMPPELLESQLDTLEPLGPDERGVLVDVANPPERIGRIVMAQLDRPRGG